MATTRDLLTKALRSIMVVAAEEPPAGWQIDYAKDIADELLESWSLDSLSVHANVHDSHTLTADASITIGTGGDFNTDRPIEIIDARVTDSGTHDYRVRLVTLDVWTGLTVKTTNTDFIDMMYYSPEYPLGKIYFSSIPNTGNTLKIVSRKLISALPALDTVIDYPPGYERALKLGIALELAPQYGFEPSPALVSQAAEAMALVRRTNALKLLGTIQHEGGLDSRGDGHYYDINAGPR